MDACQQSLISKPSNPKHPAPYTETLIPVMAGMLNGRKRILDPFAGSGRCFLLEKFVPDCEVFGTEIEPEWAACHPRTTLGNALALPWADGYFDAVATSCTYGNRMADHHNAKDASQRRTYRHMLGRELHPDNSGALQWGDAYRTFHVKAWTEARRVLSVGGAFVLNIKDHIRAGVVQPVTAWHVDTLQVLGFRMLQHERINTPSMRYGRNAELRVEYESVILFELTTKEVA